MGFHVLPRWRPAGTPPPPAVRDWVMQAACAGRNGDWFGNPNYTDLTVEKAVCEACPVREACLAYALDAGESYGIWGGLTTEERRTLVHQRLSQEPPAVRVHGVRRRWAA
ncbi:MAG TPA: WhiB family transcriptional regulator [Propionibacteriaceae bacterium]|nr:WhiB family transcriptional regulator [Propionibacteriaceae bacterium]